MRVRSKVVEVEAYPFTLSAVDQLIAWMAQHGTKSMLVGTGLPPEQRKLYIDTLEGVSQADQGDWIIRGTAGEFYPIKPDVFATRYEEIVDE